MRIVPLASTVHPIRSGRSSRIRPSRRAFGAALAAVLAIGLSACAPDPVNDSFLSGDNPGYVAADGAIIEIPVAERGEPVVDFEGGYALFDTDGAETAQRVLRTAVAHGDVASFAPKHPSLAQIFKEVIQ